MSEDNQSASTIIDVLGVKNIIGSSQKVMSLLQDETQLRAHYVTETLQTLSKQQQERYKFKRIMQVIIVAFFMAIVAALTVFIGIAGVRAVNMRLNTELIIAFISGCVTYLGSVISIIAIIVKYIFPNDEDKLLNDLMVKVIEKENTN